MTEIITENGMFEIYQHIYLCNLLYKCKEIFIEEVLRKNASECKYMKFLCNGRCFSNCIVNFQYDESGKFIMKENKEPQWSRMKKFGLK